MTDTNQSTVQQGGFSEAKVRLPISYKLAFAFLGLVMLTVSVTLVTLIGLTRLNDAVDVAINKAGREAQLADEMDLSLLEARSKEKDYLLVYKTLGLEEARNEYVAAVQTTLDAIRKQVAELAQLESQNMEDDSAVDSESLADFAQISSLIDRYEANFLFAVDKIEERGLNDEGAEGHFRDAVRNLENALERELSLDLPDAAAINITLLQMRRNEREYMLYGGEVYVANVQTLAQQLKSQIADSIFAPRSIRAYIGFVESYLSRFDALVAADVGVAAAIEAIRNSARYVTPVVARRRAEALAEQQIAVDNVEQVTAAVRIGVIGGSVTAIVLGILVAVAMTRNIANPIRSLSDVARKVAAGDLMAQANVQSRDEIGMLAHIFNQMLYSMRRMLQSELTQRETLELTIASYAEHMTIVADGNLSARLPLNGHAQDDEDPLLRLGHHLNEMTASLQHTISQQHEAAGNLKAAVSEILAATSQQMSGVSEQSAAATQTTITMEEVLTTSHEGIKRAQEVVNLAQRTVDVSRDGKHTVQQTIAGMIEIKQLVEGIAENIVMLAERTQQIGEIITTVNEIAAQSKMLALNASVEAARAGEHGRSFAVVAQEVRNLAQQSSQATAQVKSILTDIQQATSKTVMVTEKGSKGVDQGLKLATRAQTVIDKLTQAIDESAQAALQMMSGGQQQATGIEQMALAMKSIQQASLQNLAATRQTEKSAQGLDELAGKLNQMVARYQV